jgi:tRNA (cytidine/uridine-2'-O-)-methyltransferase
LLAAARRVFEIVLYQPEIPGNTGNVIRLCANTGCTLHLVQPLGFSLSDRQMKRAGLDYHEYANLAVHENWLSFRETFSRRNVYAFTTKGSRCYTDVRFQRDDVFVFGPETRGLPPEILAEFASERRLRLPMAPRNRSLNLSNAVAVAVFEAWRQLGFPGGA